MAMTPGSTTRGIKGTSHREAEATEGCQQHRPSGRIAGQLGAAGADLKIVELGELGHDRTMIGLLDCFCTRNGENQHDQTCY